MKQNLLWCDLSKLSLHQLISEMDPNGNETSQTVIHFDDELLKIHVLWRFKICNKQTEHFIFKLSWQVKWVIGSYCERVWCSFQCKCECVWVLLPLALLVSLCVFCVWVGERKGECQPSKAKGLWHYLLKARLNHLHSHCSPFQDVVSTKRTW